MAVDSGQVMIVDPCYVLPGEYGDEKSPYRKVCDKTSGNVPAGEVDIPAKHGGIAQLVASSSGYGDGEYPVYATVENGRVMKLEIDFSGEEEEKDGE